MGTERAGRKLHLKTPISREQLGDLVVGDEVWIDGIIWGIRDASLIRLFDEKIIPDIDFTGAVFLHTAPSFKVLENGDRVPISVGTTTSMRMDRFTAGCINDLNGAAIIGKGGLSDKSLHIFQNAPAVYLSITGGAASVETQQVEAIEAVIWEDLMPECIWKFRVKGFGPLFVSMDSHGNSLYEDVMKTVDANLQRYIETLKN